MTWSTNSVVVVDDMSLLSPPRMTSASISNCSVASLLLDNDDDSDDDSTSTSRLWRGTWIRPFLEACCNFVTAASLLDAAASVVAAVPAGNDDN